MNPTYTLSAIPALSEFPAIPIGYKIIREASLIALGTILPVSA
jgi:hypothetical protein